MLDFHVNSEIRPISAGQSFTTTTTNVDHQLMSSRGPSYPNHPHKTQSMHFHQNYNNGHHGQMDSASFGIYNQNNNNDNKVPVRDPMGQYTDCKTVNGIIVCADNFGMKWNIIPVFKSKDSGKIKILIYSSWKLFKTNSTIFWEYPSSARW